SPLGSSRSLLCTLSLHDALPISSGLLGPCGRRDDDPLEADQTMYVSGEPSYFVYWASAPIAARSSRAHSRVYEFGGISVVVPSQSKTSLNAVRCSSFVRTSSILPIRCSRRFIPRTNSLHWAKNFACSSRVMERPALQGPLAPLKLRNLQRRPRAPRPP